MSTTIKLVQGDDLPGVSFTIRDASRAAEGQELDKKDSDTWRPVDLSCAYVSAAIAESGGNVQIDAAEVVVMDSTAGEVMIHFNDCTFLDKAGVYDCEVTVTFSEGQQTVYEVLVLDVRERIHASAPR